MKRIGWTAICAAAAVAWAGSASALTLTTMISGYIHERATYPHDVGGLFGPAGEDLTDVTFNLTIIYEGDVIYYYPVDNGYVYTRIDGTSHATLSINGHDVEVGGGPYFPFYYSLYDENPTILNYIVYGTPGSPDYNSHISISIGAPSHYDINTSYDFAPMGDNGSFEIVGPNGGVAGGDFVAQHATITPSNIAVPEPSAWALAIIGFGMVGAVARRRYRLTSVSAGLN